MRSLGSAPHARYLVGAGFLGRSLLALAFCGVCGCASNAQTDEFVGLGLTRASVDPRPGTYAPVRASEPGSLIERARLLAAMRQTLDAARDEGVPTSDASVLVPLVTVDGGLGSAQLTWVAVHRQGNKLERLRAERVAIVSVLLDPVRVLDVQATGGALEPDEAANVFAWLLARDRFPAARFDLFVVPESVATGVEHRVHPWARRGRDPENASSGSSQAPERGLIVAFGPRGKPRVRDASSEPGDGSSADVMSLARRWAAPESYSWPVRLEIDRASIVVHRDGRFTTR